MINLAICVNLRETRLNCGEEFHADLAETRGMINLAICVNLRETRLNCGEEFHADLAESCGKPKHRCLVQRD